MTEYFYRFKISKMFFLDAKNKQKCYANIQEHLSVKYCFVHLNRLILRMFWLYLKTDFIV
jgi:hypothetical protein